MKYIKYFEGVLGIGEFWYIEGDFKQVSKVLEKYDETHPKYEHDMEICLRAFYNADKDDLIGLYFSALNVWKGYEEGVKVSHSFYGVGDEKDKVYGYNLFSNQGSIYGGVMKIEDDKLYIDTMEIDVKKYNL